MNRENDDYQQANEVVHSNIKDTSKFILINHVPEFDVKE